jgi:DNA-binding transcriptional LysR family regulator
MDQLRTFVVAADELNFTRAAELLHLTQPAVSQQIKELENFFQLPLFERRGRQVQLSLAGEKLRPYARHILSQVDEARTMLWELAGRVYGKLLVGSGNTLGIYLLPMLLGQFQDEYPDVLVSLKVDETSEILEMLSHGELDIALLEESPTESKLRQLVRKPFLKDELVLIAPPEGISSTRKFPSNHVSQAELLSYPIIMRQLSSRTRQLILARLMEGGVDVDRMNVIMELGNTEALKRAVMAGLGVGWASPYAIRQELEAGLLRVVSVENVRIERQLWLVTQQERYLPERVQRFQEYLLAQMPALQLALGDRESRV